MRAIITYHSIDDSGSVISIDERTFARHIGWLAAHVKVMPLQDLLLTPEHEDAVAITFDDGFRNFARCALPILRAHGLPATVFVVCDYVGQKSGWSDGGFSGIPKLPLMNWDLLGKVQQHGITIGSHTRTHPDLSTLDNARLADEVAVSAEILQARLGTRPSCFAYPYGEISDAAVAAARDAYACACTTELRTLAAVEDAVQLPRVDAYYLRSAGSIERFGTPAFRRFLWLRRQRRSVRRVLANAGVRV